MMREAWVDQLDLQMQDIQAFKYKTFFSGATIEAFLKASLSRSTRPVVY